MNGFLNESNFLMVEEGFTTRDLLENLLGELCQESQQQAFFVADLGDIVKKHLCFLKALPRVKPYFPVKCNGSEGVIRLLAELGAGFACANKAEITRVQGIGVPPDRIFYSSPCKQVAHLRYAASHGVRLMAFDNEVELSKVARSHPRARMLLGITADPIPAAHPSLSFGSTLESCGHLLHTAKDQALEVVGISFHLGSRGLEPQAWAQAVATAQLVFDMGTELGHHMHLLDIGGGFPATEDTRAPLEEIAAGINSALDLYFPEGSGVEIIARPGRYYVTSAFTLAVSITALEEIPVEQPGSDEEECGSKKSLVYHLSDGIYGAFSCLLFDSPCPRPRLHKRPCPEQPWHSCSLRGPGGNLSGFLVEEREPAPLWLSFWGTGEPWSVPIPFSRSCSPLGVSPCRKTMQLFQGKAPQTEDERESLCTPLSCGWEMAETLCVPPVFAPAGII
ncbi:antizyme inhibitor 2 isoform X1 [Geospiza fortis]|uniref:Antizyme inhibitor 2 n=1 Tax=Geospiza fortis TaxID=48883 RepID=A0A6I9GZS1_GEOFO|nr:antizyme inhibitor 2 [Geospiza fortis]XP_030917867.1 antizyme inhibitor 2 isoform X1 [Geospiza fortis]